MPISYASIKCSLCSNPLVAKTSQQNIPHPDLYCEKCVEIIDLLNAFLTSDDKAYPHDLLPDRYFPGFKNYLFNPNNQHYSLSGISLSDWKSFITNPNIPLSTRREPGEVIEMTLNFICFESKSAIVNYFNTSYILPYKCFFLLDGENSKDISSQSLGNRSILILTESLHEIFNNQ